MSDTMPPAGIPARLVSGPCRRTGLPLVDRGGLDRGSAPEPRIVDGSRLGP